MNCDKCEIGLRVQLAKAYGGSWSLTAEEVEQFRAECLKCKPENFNHHGEIHTDLALGEGRLPYSVSRDYLAALRPSHERATPLPPTTEDALLELLHRFAELDLAAVQLLHGLLNGKNCAELATELGMNSRQAVHARLKRAMREHPWLSAVHMGTKLGVRDFRRKRTR